MWGSIKHALGAAAFTEKEGGDIICPLHFLSISSLGAARKFPMEFRVCPKTSLGLEMPHPFVKQGIQGINVAMKHTPLSFHKKGTMTGSFVELSLENLQLEAGCAGPVLESDLAPCEEMIAPCWLEAVWHFVAKCKGIKLKREKHMDEFVPCIGRVNNEHLIPCLMSEGHQGKSMEFINRVRMHEEVSTLADLATGDG